MHHSLFTFVKIKSLNLEEKEVFQDVPFIIYLNYIWRLSSYHAVNTLRLGYKNQSVSAVYGNSRCLFWEALNHINTRCGQNVELFV